MTDRIDIALLAGRLDRKVEFGLPDLEGRTHILRIHAKVTVTVAGIGIGIACCVPLCVCFVSV